MEPNGHPDLVHIGRLLRERMDRTLEAEMEAARAAARRTRSLRDVLLGIEDRGSRALVSATDGSFHTGALIAVGADHIELSGSSGRRIVSLAQIVSVEER